ncbi:2TM domain-containing protein [Pseudofulvibacter geojedonensis]|uniref:2TM domain-containing protein n=1 Tax=Pseudofulvibacter geojedonensis TaxID=1123758 RepID=A0ABW3HZ68_9FLAO
MSTLFKHIKLSISFGLVIYLIILLIRYFSGYSVVFNNHLLFEFLIYMLYSLVLYGVNAFIFIQLDRKFGKDNFTKKRIVTGFVLSIVLTMLAVFFLRVIEEVVIEKGSFLIFLENEKIGNYLIPFIITVIGVLFFSAFFFYKSLQDKKIKEQKIIAGTASAKFESLKSQLDPHFLFNSLNVLTSLIEEDQDKAQKFTTSLSKVYRYVLEQKDKDLVSLEEELHFAKTYMSLLKMRFEGAIFIELPKVINNPEAKVVPLSLQILLENCIKHNVVSEGNPLKIRVVEDNDQLIVINNFQPKQTVKKSSGVGLQNIKERYNILSTREMFISQQNNEFTVQIPLLTKKSSIMKSTENKSVNSDYINARKRLDKLKDFYGSLVAYVIVIPFLIFINLKTYSGVHWFWFPMLGWGIGLAFQAYEVYGKDKYFGKSWEDKKIREFMEEEEKNNRQWR